MAPEIWNQAIATFFAILQAGLLAVVAAGIKMYFDVKILRKDMDAAFIKIRELEDKAWNCGSTKKTQ